MVDPAHNGSAFQTSHRFSGVGQVEEAATFRSSRNAMAMGEQSEARVASVPAHDRTEVGGW